MWNLVSDISYAIRHLRRSPGFALTAVLTLTMAIGANVIVFGILDSLVLHPLPVPEPNRVVQIGPPGGLAQSYPDYVDIRDRNRTFSGVAMFRICRVGLDTSGTAEPAWGYEASGNYFEVLGAKPFLGRFFGPREDTKIDGDPYIVLSYDAWKARFAGDPGVVGRIVRLNKHVYTVLGVAPRYFHGTEKLIWPDFWVPVHDEPQIEGYNWIEGRHNGNAWLIGRLKVGVTPAAANADLASIAAQVVREHPDVSKALKWQVAKPGLLGDMLGPPAHAFLFGVMSLAVLVLLAGCLNLGGLFAARTTDRARELGIRIALGSSRVRILRQLLTESTMVAVLGGLIATTLARSLLRLLSSWHPTSEFPARFLVEPDMAVYLSVVLVALITGILFGALPARLVWTTDPNHSLKATGSADVLSRRLALRDVLLAIQIALCCLLVTASLVSLRSLLSTLNLRLGIQPEGVMFASTDVYLAGYEKDAIPQVQKRLLEEVSKIPGVTMAAYSRSTPLYVDTSTTAIFPPGTTDFSFSNARLNAYYYEISPGYFSVAGTRLLAGRFFNQGDNPQSPRVAIVNQTFARKLFGTEAAVGKHYPEPGGKQVEIVGIVEDGKYETLTEEPKAAIFWPALQTPNSTMVLLVKTGRSPSEMIPALRQAIASVDPALPVFGLSPWRDAISFVLIPTRAASISLGVLGGLAIMLAFTGIFAMASYTVSKRMRELGIRSALGAQRSQILFAALGRVLALLATGSAAGLALGFAAGRILAGIVYQASPSDPEVVLGVIVAMAFIGLVSAAVPARRAISLDPARLLRDE
ncbi:MAG: ABC transporter permease [Acidobacteriaceae bacterium]